MNNTVIGIIMALLVVGGGAYFLLGNSSSDDDTSVVDNEETAENVVDSDAEGDVPSAFSGTLGQLFGFGQNIMCTFTQDDEDASGTGAIYVSGDKMRGDIKMTMKTGEGTLEASTIQKDDTIYSWGETPFGPFATKVAVQEEDKGKGHSPVDFDDEIDYKCEKWRVDNDKFDLPNDVSFDDINAEMQQINEATEAVTDLQCDACDQVPDPAAQAQCKAALGC